MIYTVTLNPALDKTIEISDFKVDSVNRAEKTRIDAGGKGINVSRVLKHLDADTVALGILGGYSGRQLEKILVNEGINSNFLTVDSETRTNIKIVDYKNNTYTDINEGGFLNDNGAVDKLLCQLLVDVTDKDTVVFAGSLPKGADENIYNKWIDEFTKKGVKVFLDADKNALKSGISAKPYFIKPNIDEFSALTNKNFECMIDIKVSAMEFVKKGIKKVAVTLGKGGSILVSENGAFYAAPLNVTVKSTVGAGDSFLASVAFCEQLGKSDADTLKFAAAVSSAKVMCEAVCPPSNEMIQKLLSEIRIEEI